MHLCTEAILTMELVASTSELILLSDLVFFLGLRPSAVQNDALVVQNSSKSGYPVVRMTDRCEYSDFEEHGCAVRDEV